MKACRHCGLAPMHGKPRHRPTCPFELPDTTVARELAEHPDLAGWDTEADVWYPTEESRDC